MPSSEELSQGRGREGERELHKGREKENQPLKVRASRITQSAAKLLPSKGKRADFAFMVGDVTTELSLPHCFGASVTVPETGMVCGGWGGGAELQISSELCQGPPSLKTGYTVHAGLLTTSKGGCLGPLQFLKADGGEI